MLASAVIYCLTQRSRIIYPVYHHPSPPPNYRADLFHVRLLEMQRYTFALHSFRHRGACAPPPHSEFPLVNTIQEEHPTPRFQFISPSPPRVLRNCAMSAINCPLRYPNVWERQRIDSVSSSDYYATRLITLLAYFIFCTINCYGKQSPRHENTFIRFNLFEINCSKFMRLTRFLKISINNKLPVNALFINVPRVYQSICGILAIYC